MKYIIGIGAYAMFDDSIGIRVIENIVEKNLEKGFRALDLSGNSLNLVSYLNSDTQKILIVDSANLGISPGDFRFFAPEEVTSEKCLDGFSTHEGDMVKTLCLARDMGYPIPKVVFLGIQPLEMKNEFGLSNPLQANLKNYVQAAINEIEKD
ncbi:MAG: hydrogenase maturation protease [Candidatus Riflebacteria bacterium]|nr:hydrogenase maturation protease [Candidatus Riflebacteria bacterium]